MSRKYLSTLQNQLGLIALWEHGYVSEESMLQSFIAHIQEQGFADSEICWRMLHEARKQGYISQREIDSLEVLYA